MEDGGKFQRSIDGHGGGKPPALTAAQFDQNLNITVTTEAGRSYWLLESTNLVFWAALAKNAALAATPLQFVRPNLTDLRRFPLVVTPPYPVHPVNPVESCRKPSRLTVRFCKIL